MEVKAAKTGCPERLYDTLSAFSNQDDGGILLFGVDERSGFAPCGVYDAADLQHRVTEQCKEMEPPVRALFTVAEKDVDIHDFVYSSKSSLRGQVSMSIFVKRSKILSPSLLIHSGYFLPMTIRASSSRLAFILAVYGMLSRCTKCSGIANLGILSFR